MVIHKNNLKQYMKDHKITVWDLEESSGISECAIKQTRLHHTEPTKITKECISIALGVEESILFPMKEIIGPSTPHSGSKYIKKLERLSHYAL